MTKEFFESVLRIPSASSHENMMMEFIMDWGKSHGCKTKQDSKGNVYLEKGSGIRPAFVNHADTVHHDQIEMVKQKVYKEIVWDGNHVTAKNPLTGKQTGLGMDNQGGCCIALAVVDRLPAVKALFTVEEEIGMRGIAAADMSFFDDAAFVFSNDSPDRNRATHYSSGVELYSKEFFDKYLEPICKKHGVTDFRSEPWTCIKIVKTKWTNKDGKHLECLNFGNAGDRPHSDQEGADFSGVCAAEELLYALCTEIPTDVQHVSDISPEPRSWSSYGGYGGYGGYGSRQSSWGSYWQDRYSARQSALGKSAGGGHDFTDVASFTWTAPDAEKAGILKKQLDGFPKGMLEVVSNATDKGESVTVKAQYRDLKFAYLAALNCVTGKAYRNWWEMEKAEPEAARQFERVIRWEKPAASDDPMSKSFWTDWPSVSKEKETSSEAALTIAFKDETQVDRFMDRIQKEGIAVDVDDTVPDEVTVSGDLQDVKGAYVVAFNVLNKKGLREFRELSQAAKDRFWSNVVWGSGSGTDDEKPEGGDDDAIEADAEVLPSSEEPKYDEGDLWDWYNSRQ